MWGTSSVVLLIAWKPNGLRWKFEVEARAFGPRASAGKLRHSEMQDSPIHALCL